MDDIAGVHSFGSTSLAVKQSPGTVGDFSKALSPLPAPHTRAACVCFQRKLCNTETEIKWPSCIRYSLHSGSEGLHTDL